MAGGTGKIVHQMRTGSLIDWKTVTGHSTPHAKGTWVPLVSSLPEAVQFVKLMVTNSGALGVQSDMLLDIGVGADGSEVVKIPLVQVGYVFIGGVAGSTRPPRVWGLPISIPSGSRVAARIQSFTPSDTVSIAMDFYGGFPAASGEPADSIDTMGVADPTTQSRGTNLTTGLTADTEPLTWTEIEDSTANAYRALAVSIGGDGAITQNCSLLLDIGVGSATNEVEVIADIPFSADTTETIGSWADLGVFPLEDEIASGSRISARLMGNHATPNSDFYVNVHGIK